MSHREELLIDGLVVGPAPRPSHLKCAATLEVDHHAGVACWVRLHTGELPILWNSAGQEYNPDFIAIDTDGTHWVVEVKMDKEMESTDVKGKREAARRWANYVTADEKVRVPWRYLLASEADIETAKGSWPALKALGDS